MGKDIKIVGVEKVIGKLKKNMTLDDLKRVVRKDGADMTDKIVDHAVFTKGYSHGDTRESIHLEITDNGLTAEAGPSTAYSEYLEWGTRLMDSQPFVKPGFDEQKEIFKKHVKEMMR